jgi:hypothetical protein
MQRNLVQNAVRHSPPGTHPQITASSYGTTVEIRVIDCGPGVPETDWDHIFQPFQRLGDRDNTSGVGLGLALSRGLVEAMSGTLTPEETPGGGLPMTISLPAVTRSSPEAAAGATGSSLARIHRSGLASRYRCRRALRPSGTSVRAAVLPIALFEFSLGVYLTVKGFKPSPITADMV